MAEDKLNYLITHYRDLPQQQSKQWFILRSLRLGGSETSIIDRSEKAILKYLKTRRKKNKSLYCRWGNLFEDIAKAKLRHEGYEIHEFGGIPSTNLPFAYSPDGILIKDGKLMLLEIKCPFIRDIIKKPEVSSAYKRQLQMGLNITPCDVGWFKQYMFRRVSYEQWAENKSFNRPWHKNYKIKLPDGLDVWGGLIVWEGKHMFMEDFREERPSKIYYSFNEDIMLRYKQLRTGYACFFKCFHETSEIVEPEPFTKEEIAKMWLIYGKMLDLYN